MFYATNSGMTVTGGMFTQNTDGWMFNTLGNAAGNIITVTGGTFNRYFIGGAAYGENTYGEVVLAEGLALVESEIAGYWTIADAAAKRVDADGKTIKAYATLAAALAEAEENETIFLLADNAESVSIDKNVALDLNGFNYTGEITLTAVVALTADETLNVVTNVADHKVVYADGAHKVVELIYVAQVGEAKFESLQAAVDAAQDGDTVKVIADHEIPCDVTPLITVSGKDITIDLNGKNITANAVGASTTVRVVFQTEADAKLTMTDSVGTGAVIANGDGVLYYMFRNSGEMTIAGGNYVLNAINGGAMFYSENSNMTVTGGMFTQNTTGWMFNTAGNSTHTITVSGGTFNRYFIGGNTVVPEENTKGEVVLAEGLALVESEIAGYWTIGDAAAKRVDADGKTIKAYVTLAAALAEAKAGEKIVLLADNAESVTIDKAVELVLNRWYYTGEVTLTANATLTAPAGLNVTTNVETAKVVYEDGIYSVVEMNYVAQIGETKYESLTEALAAAQAGQTVVVIADIVENGYIIVDNGVTLDLNGHTVKASGVMAFDGNHIIDSSDANTGVLIVAKNRLILDQDNAHLPIWNGEGYQFFAMRKNAAGDDVFNLKVKKEENKFVFQPLFDADAHELIAKGSATSGVTVTVRLTWNVVDKHGNATGEVRSQDFKYTDALIKSVVESYGKKTEGKYASQFSLALSGTEELDNLMIQVVVKSDCGVQVVSAGSLYA